MIQCKPSPADASERQTSDGDPTLPVRRQLFLRVDDNYSGGGKALAFPAPTARLQSDVRAQRACLCGILIGSVSARCGVRDRSFLLVILVVAEPEF